MAPTFDKNLQQEVFPHADLFPAPLPSLPAPYEDSALLQEVFAAASRRTVIIVSLDAVRHNITTLRGLAGPSTEVMAVVKGAAYGSGVMGVVRTALDAGATELAVATVSEGTYLRKEGVTAPITVLGNLGSEELPDVLEHRLHPTIAWSECLLGVDAGTLKYKDGTPLQVQVEVDTGMSRYGAQPSDLPALVASVRQTGVLVRSIYTHYQNSITVPERNKRQLQMFLEVTEQFKDVPRHVAATVGCVQRLGTNLDYIRPGGAVTGLSLGSSVEDTEEFAKCSFQPSFSVVARPSFYKLLPGGRDVGYDATYTSRDDEYIANFNMGWSDGLARRLTNFGHVRRLKTGQLCPIVGRVSMDSITVRLPECPAPDEAFAIITADFHPLTSAVGVARGIGCAVDEVPGNWSTRLPRVTVEGGKVKHVHHSLDYSN